MLLLMAVVILIMVPLLVFLMIEGVLTILLMAVALLEMALWVGRHDSNEGQTEEELSAAFKDGVFQPRKEQANVLRARHRGLCMPSHMGRNTYIKKHP